MRILILSNAAWSDNNCFGNSFSNLFEGMEKIEIANIFCKCGAPNNAVVSKYFQITEKLLLKNLKNKHCPAGIMVNARYAGQRSKGESAVFNYARKNRFILFFWARDLIWKFGRWRSNELKEFIDDFNPDLLFMPIYYSSYLNDIQVFIKKYSKKPMLGYVSDDVYTLKQFSFSPFYWLDRLIKRKKVRKMVGLCEHIYVISEIQRKEYEKCFHKECRLLWKGAEFAQKPVYQAPSGIIKLVYTGNLGAGRYKQLSAVGEAIRKINFDGKKMELDIYSLTPMTGKMKKMLDIPDAIYLKGGAAAEQIEEIQKNADILVHVESFDIKNKLAVRQSFSTKIVDYLAKAKCILAVGPSDVASIDYLIKNDAAVVAVNKDEIEKKLRSICKSPKMLQEYGDKAWECGRRNHQIREIQNKLYHDFEEVVDEGSTN